MNVDFTGERFIPGKTSKRIADDHFARYKFALQFVAGKSVLDFACGSGYGSLMLKKEGRATEVDGADVSRELIDYAKDNFATEGVSFFVDDLAEHHFKKKYDVVTCFETIEHIEDYRKALKNIFDLLNPDGLLIISTPNRLITSPNLGPNQKPSNPFHVREFTVPEFRQELKNCGFIVNDNDIYGQRQQRYFKNRYLRRLYKIIFQPDINFSAEIKPLKYQPRNFLIVARKK